MKYFTYRSYYLKLERLLILALSSCILPDFWLVFMIPTPYKCVNSTNPSLLPLRELHEPPLVLQPLPDLFRQLPAVPPHFDVHCNPFKLHFLRSDPLRSPLLPVSPVRRGLLLQPRQKDLRRDPHNQLPPVRPVH